MISSAVVVGLAIGVLVGRREDDVQGGNVGKVRTDESRASRGVLASNKDKERSYRKLVDHVRQNGFIPEEGADFLARAGKDEILQMMESLSEIHAATGGWGTGGAAYRSMHAAARELCRREGVGAVEWALGKTSSLLVSQTMIAELSRLNPEMGKRFIQEHYRRFGNSAVWNFTNSALEGAVGRSAGELLECEKGMRITTAVNLDGFADDFDFEDYLSKTQTGMMRGSVFQAWAAKDPDAAGEALLTGVGGNDEKQAGNFWGALKGRAAMVGEDAAADWLLPKMDILTEVERRSALEYVAGQDPPVGRVKAFLERLPDGPERMNFAMRVVSLHRQNGGARQMIAGNFPEEFRTSIAEEWFARNAKQATPELSEKMMSDLKIPEAKREELRAKRPEE